MTEIFEKIIASIEEGLKSAFSDFNVVIMQIVATILLIIIVRFLFWKPITKLLEANKKALNKELYEVRHENNRVQEIRRETQKEYETVKAETAQIKKRLIDEAHQERDIIIEEARNEAKRRLDQVEYDVKESLKNSNDKIKKSIKEVAFAAASKIIEREIDEDIHEDVIDELIKEHFD